jgi:thiol-disulfide isomerase/thioredoxin|tara:strand:- start:5893 stop:6261 length:369 start_codon:yes stop_codon:yes gene_type:complete
MNKLIFILLLPLTTFAQDFVGSSDFNSKIAKGISVVEFWAEWNKSNEVDFLGKLKDCNSYKLCIVKNSSVQKKYNVSAIPTIIIFDNGTEQSRFTPNIMMQLQATKKDVQSVINEITFNKFQ